VRIQACPFPAIEGVADDQQADHDGARAALVELTAWASLAAARRVGTWIPRGAAEAELDRGTTGTHHAGP
jgi:hypothetical protein